MSRTGILVPIAVAYGPFDIHLGEISLGLIVSNLKGALLAGIKPARPIYEFLAVDRQQTLCSL
ncbi:MAG TPA: hypothetical protein VF503_22230 [Sphingobium sp.]|uniref:hypothetical protein n=1 Tax=Sphingobium sp. TaxID=1912891 RepID=UPI002ED2CCEA